MNVKQVSSRLLSALLVAAIFFACRHQLDIPDDGNPPTPPVSASACDPDTVYFTNDIMPIISSNCTMSGCHDNITHAEGVNLTTYSKIRQYVRPGDPGNSELYKVITKTNDDRMPPRPRPALTTEQKAKIQKWISQGARNNSCTGNCDTTVFTYSGAIQPMMSNKCVGCHNPSNPEGNTDLSSYNGVKAAALNGKLYGTVAHQTGYSPMPKNGAKLLDCEIRQVQLWISNGSLNN